MTTPSLIDRATTLAPGDAAHEALRAWCEAYGRGAISFLARKTGRTFAAVSRVVKGQANPSPETASRLELATEGAVRASAWFGFTTGTINTKRRRASPTDEAAQ